MKSLIVITISFFFLCSCGNEPLSVSAPEDVTDDRVCYLDQPCRVIEELSITSKIQCGHDISYVEKSLLDQPQHCWVNQ